MDDLSFEQAIDLLKSLTAPAINDNSEKLVRVVSRLCDRIDSINFDLIVNELTYQEYETLYDAYYHMKFSKSKLMRSTWANHLQNDSLRRACEQRKLTESHYPESMAGKYDPLKPKVVGGLTESLIRADLMDLKTMQDNETDGLYKEMYPYKPDVLMGHKGKKVGLFVLNEDGVMRDTLEPNGDTFNKMRIVEQAHQIAGKSGSDALRGVSLPVSRVVKADLKSQKLELKKDFNL